MTLISADPEKMEMFTDLKDIKRLFSDSYYVFKYRKNTPGFIFRTG